MCLEGGRSVPGVGEHAKVDDDRAVRLRSLAAQDRPAALWGSDPIALACPSARAFAPMGSRDRLGSSKPSRQPVSASWLSAGGPTFGRRTLRGVWALSWFIGPVAK